MSVRSSDLSNSVDPTITADRMLPNTDSSISYDDTALVTALRNGEYSAFEIVYRDEFSGLYRYAESLVSHEDAIDAVQDVFFAVWNNRTTLTVQSDQELRYYLFRAVRNRAYKINRYDEVRTRHNHEIAHSEDIVAPGYGSHCQEDESSVSANDLSERVKQVIIDLPPRSREVLTLRWYHNLPFDQIAGIMGISYSYAHVLHSRALGMIRKHLGLK